MNPLHFSLNSLIVFHEVAKHKSFSKAAERLFISQPAVTQSIKEIELNLGMPLILRERRGITLTSVGRILFKYTYKISSHLMEIENVLGNLQQKHYGLLRIGTTEALSKCLMPKLLSRFQSSFPNLRISVDVGDSDKIKRSLLTYQNDLALIGVTNRLSPRFESYSFLNEELVLIVPPTHPLASNGPVSLKKIEEYPLIIRLEGSTTRKILLKAFNDLGIHPLMLIEAASSEFIKQCVLEGKGISIIGKRTAEDEEKRGVIKTIPLLDKLHIEVAFVFLKKERFNFAVKTFLNFVEKQGRRLIKS